MKKTIASPTWLPDWNNSKAYPDSKTALPTQWAWEFLRRNPNYQRDYEIASLIPSAIDLEKEPEKWEGRKHIRANYHVFKLMDPAEKYSKTTEERLGWKAYGGPKYLNYMGPAPGKEIKGWKDTIELKLRPGQVMIIFNVGLDIPVQLQRARIILNWSQKLQCQWGMTTMPKRIRRRFSEFPLYLRLLDGLASGAKISEMVEVLLPAHENSPPHFPASDLLRKGIKTAKQLRDKDYIWLHYFSAPGK